MVNSTRFASGDTALVIIDQAALVNYGFLAHACR